MTARTAPTWATSASVLVTLALAFAGFQYQQGQQARAQEHSDAAVVRLEREIERLWDATRANRAELQGAYRREIDLACRCCATN